MAIAVESSMAQLVRYIVLGFILILSSFHAFGEDTPAPIKEIEEAEEPSLNQCTALT